MSKSLTFSWDWLGTAAYHEADVQNYHTMLTKLAKYMDEGKLVTTLGKRYKLTLAGLRKAHRQIETGRTVGKVGLGVDEEGAGAAFC